MKHNPFQLKLSVAFLIVGIVIAEFEYFGYGVVGPGITSSQVSLKPKHDDFDQLMRENNELRRERDVLRDQLKTLHDDRDE